MTTENLTPYWPAVEDWTGFLLVIVPVGALPVPGAELCRRVRAQVETDPVLYDLVTVSLAPPIEPTADWDRAFVASVIEAALPDQHFFAPRGVIGVVAVAGDEEVLKSAYGNLRDLPPANRLWVRLFGAVARSDPRGGVSQGSVERIARAVNLLVEMYDEQPQIATAEPTFLDRVGTLLREHRLSRSARRPEPATAAEPAIQSEPAIPAVRSAVDAEPVSGQRPRHPERSAPPPESPAVVAEAPASPVGQPTRRLLDPVMYDGAEIITVDKRTPVQKLMRQTLTDADCMDELQRDGRAVGLLHLVFVPDDGVVPKAAAKRRNAIALELDQAFASVQRDATTGQPARIAVEVFSATNPLQKHGVLRVAGETTESALPKVKIEYFSVPETVVPLLDAARRTSRALRARGLDVVSQHFVFLAAMRFPADETTRDDWVDLLEQARVTWIDFSPADRRQPLYPMPPSPFGLHVLTDKEDVLSVIKKQSEAIYLYAPELAPPTAPGIASAANDPIAAAPPVEDRHWWPFRKRLTE